MHMYQKHLNTCNATKTGSEALAANFEMPSPTERLQDAVVEVL